MSLNNIFFILAVGLFGASAGAANSGISYQGRVLKPDGSPLEGASVQFRMQLRSPDANNCLLYEETQTQDMRHSRGQFAITMNDGSGVRTDTSGLNLDRVFSNIGTMAVGASNCVTGSSYSPNSGDGRDLLVLFKDETMSAWEPIPTQKINFVPFAVESKLIQGFAADSLLRVVDSGGLPLGGLAPLSNAQYTELLKLVNGTSTTYTAAGRLGAAPLPTMTAGQVLGWTGTAWESVDTVATNSVTTAKIVDGAISSAKIADGTISQNDLAPNISVVTSGGISSNVQSTRSLKLFDLDAAPNDHSITFVAPASLAANSTYTLPPLDGSNGQTLTTNGAGVLSWATAVSSQWQNGASNSINYTAGKVGLGLTAPSARLHLAAGSNTVGSAPLKLSSGPLLSAPEDGAIEYESSGGFYVTIGSTRFLIPTTASAGNFTNVNSLSNATGSITVQPAAGNSLIVNQSTLSTSSSTGALVVNGGVGIAGALNLAGNMTSGGSISATNSLVSPQIFGGSSASGTIKIDGTSHATFGSVLLASAGGKVGIGTPNPLNALDVVVPDGSVTYPLRASAAAGVATIAAQSSAGNSAYLMLRRPAAGGTRWTVGMNGTAEAGSNAGSDFQISSFDDAGSALSSPFLIQRSTGRVGVGTLAPSSALDVAGGITASATSSLNGINLMNSSLTNGKSISVSNGSSGTWALSVGSTGSSTGAVTINATSGFGLSVNSGTSYFGGNVGIGTAAPASLLDIRSTSSGFNGLTVANSTAATNSGAAINLSGDSTSTNFRNYSSGQGAGFQIQSSAPTFELKSTNATGKIRFVNSSNASQLLLDTGTGNSGFGTASPALKLDVVGSAVFRGPTTGGVDGELYYDVGTHSYMYYDDGAAAWKALGTGTISYSGTLWSQSGSNISYNSGNVGIGTTPTSPLDVGGVINSSASYNLGGLNALTRSGSILQYGLASGFNTHSFYVNNSERMRLASSGNLGVGTVSPLATLHVSGSGTTRLMIGETTETAGSTAELVFRSASASSFYDKGAVIFEKNSGGNGLGSLHLAVNSAASGTSVSKADARLTINSAGNVGIGTTSPTTLLTLGGQGELQRVGTTGDFDGYFNFQNDRSFLGYDTTRGAAVLQGGTGKAIRLNVNSGTFGSGTALIVDSTGNVGIGTTSPTQTLDVAGNVKGSGFMAQANTVATPAYRFITDASSGMYLPAAFNLGFATNGLERLRIDGSGNVGIGTTSPAYKLDVSGDVRIANASKLYVGSTAVCDSAGCTASPSDARFKTNVRSLKGSLDSITKLNGVKYEWIDKSRFSKEDQIGFIAQEVERVYPEIVKTDSKTGYKSVMYDKLVAPLVEAVKTLFARLQKVELRVVEHDRMIASKVSEADLEAKLSSRDREIEHLKAANAEMSLRLQKLEALFNKK